MKTMEEFLSQELGVDPTFFLRLGKDDDWAFIIKTHALLEGALSHAITTHLADPRLADIAARLDSSDQKKGKLAFIRALEILPDGMCSLIQQLSEIRNKFVHNVRNLSIKLEEWIEKMPNADRNALRKHLLAMNPHDFMLDEDATIDAKTFVETQPRNAIMFCVVSILTTIYGKALVKSGVDTEGVETGLWLWVAAKPKPSAPNPMGLS